MSEMQKWYKSLTYDEAVDGLEHELKQIKNGYMAAGYYLKYIRDNELYKEHGYETVWEFAEDKYGIVKSTASRWMSINDKFSKDGNSPLPAEEYKIFSRSQLQEMLYLDDKQMERVTPEMTTKEIREIRKEEKKFQKPTEEQKEYLEAFARKLITGMTDWFKEKYHERVMDVTTSPEEIKNRLGNQSTWYFKVNNGTAHINLFKDYVQLWDEKSTYIADFEWFYLARAIQVMWQVVAMEKIEERRKQEAKILMQNKCLHKPEFFCTLSEAQKVATGDGIDCHMKCCWNCEKRFECGYSCHASKENSLVKTESVATSQQQEDLVNTEFEQIPGQMEVYDYPEMIPEDMQQVIDAEYREVKRATTMLTYLVEAVLEDYDMEEILLDVSEEECHEKVQDELFGDTVLFRFCNTDMTGEFLSGIEIYKTETGKLFEEYTWQQFFEEFDHVTSVTERTNQESVIEEYEEVHEETNDQSETELLRKMVDEENKVLSEVMKCFSENDVYARKQKIKVVALASLLCEWEEEDKPESEKPELPSLKNNDQRKKFLENYQTWPIWFEVPQASETYYRFDLPDGSSIVICEYRHYVEWKIRCGMEPESTYCKEYLLKPGYKYLHDCATNQTALIEHLKNVQKGK